MESTQDYCWLDDVVGVDFDALGVQLTSALAGANYTVIESDSVTLRHAA